METGGSIKFLIFNPNYFNCEILCSIDKDENFAINCPKSIRPNEKKVIQIEVKSKQIADEASESSIVLDALMTIKSEWKWMEELQVPISATLLDMLELTFEPIDFGCALIGFPKVNKFLWKCNIRRPLTYKLVLDDTDIFQVLDSEERVVNFKEEVIINIQFSPLKCMSYSVFGTLETNEGCFRVEFRGKGSVPKFIIEEKFIDFGTVGIKGIKLSKERSRIQNSKC